MELCGYRIMWTMVMFDLPVGTKEMRRDYAQFRKMLLEEGFQQLQYSVYGRCNASEESAAALERRIRKNLPPDGEVRVLQITDKQFGRMQIFIGPKPQATEQAPMQLEFF